MRSRLPQVAERTVDAIISEVPSYAGALSGPMGAKIRNPCSSPSVASSRWPRAPARRPAPRPLPAVEGAYQLGRGEARAGRSMEALLAAYRIGARASWREMSAARGVGRHSRRRPSGTSRAWCSPTSTSSRPPARRGTPTSSPPRGGCAAPARAARRAAAGRGAKEQAIAAAERVEWPWPETLTAVVVPDSQRRAVLGVVSPATLQPAEDLTGLEDRALLLVPDVAGARRTTLVRALADRDAVVGPARPTLEVRASYDRAARALASGSRGRGRVAAGQRGAPRGAGAARGPRRPRRPAGPGPRPPGRRAGGHRREAPRHPPGLAAAPGPTRGGRRRAVLPPQTVRYRMGRLRELYGDASTTPAPSSS